MRSRLEGSDSAVPHVQVAANKNLQRAVKKFNLTTEGAVGEDGSTAIWDGTRWVYEESSGWGWGWWDISKMLWR